MEDLPTGASDIQLTEPAFGRKNDEVDVLDKEVEELPTSASDIQLTEPASDTSLDKAVLDGSDKNRSFLCVDAPSRSDIYERYVSHLSCCLSDISRYKVQNGVYVSLIHDLTLQQFIHARKEYCRNKHDKNCLNCCTFIQFANDVLKDGIVELQLAFTKNFPHTKFPRQ